MNRIDLFKDCTGFEWDQGNLLKNWERHQVTAGECEQLFFNRPLVVAPDVKHSQQEPRFYALGQTDIELRLFVVFTVRRTFIRVISVRDMHWKERKAYETYEKTNPGV